MLMAVMGVAHMGMGVLQLLMTMRMGMPEGLIHRKPCKVFRRVLMAVMGILAARIMVMAVGVANGLMPMPVAVLLP
jgi:hypothetical protein